MKGAPEGGSDGAVFEDGLAAMGQTTPPAPSSLSNMVWVNDEPQKWCADGWKILCGSKVRHGQEEERRRVTGTHSAWNQRCRRIIV